MSIASIPSCVAVIGPMVEPHGTLFRDAKVCKGIPFDSATDRMYASPRADVAYLWFPFTFTAGPWLSAVHVVVHGALRSSDEWHEHCRLTNTTMKRADQSAGLHLDHVATQ